MGKSENSTAEHIGNASGLAGAAGDAGSYAGPRSGYGEAGELFGRAGESLSHGMLFVGLGLTGYQAVNNALKGNWLDAAYKTVDGVISVASAAGGPVGGIVDYGYESAGGTKGAVQGQVLVGTGQAALAFACLISGKH